MVFQTGYIVKPTTPINDNVRLSVDVPARAIRDCQPQTQTRTLRTLAVAKCHTHNKQSADHRHRILVATISWQPPPVIEGSPTLYNNGASTVTMADTQAALSSGRDTVGPRAHQYCHRGLNVHHSDTSEVLGVSSPK